MSRNPPSPPSTILILGAGAFGAAAALSLVEGPYAGHADLITILDRSSTPPALDAASSDYNKIVRQDYTDPFYASLACQALARWRSPEYARNFHECGVLVAAAANNEQAAYVRDSFAVNSRPSMHTDGKKAVELGTPAEIKRRYPARVETGDLAGNVTYFNEAGGWADSRAAVVDVLDKVRAHGVNFVAGEAMQFLYDGASVKKDVRGVVTTEGKLIRAAFTIVACGAWSSALLPDLHDELFPTGQCVGTIQLSREEADRYRNIPVSLFLDTGFYCFPPTADGLVKFAIHDRGWVSPEQAAGIPTGPRTTLTPGYSDQQIPQDAMLELTKGLARVFPELSRKPWAGSRLCWYTDRPSGDWLIDYHPRHFSLFVASGGSGHAFKFFPILGDLVLSGIYGTLTPEQASFFSYEGSPSRIDKSRGERAPLRKILPDKIISAGSTTAPERVLLPPSAAAAPRGVFMKARF